MSNTLKHTKSFFKSFASFLGPGYMVAIGYLDPGNWATDLAAGAQFGNKLLFVILLSNVVAVLLQYLCVKLGIVTKNDLAQSCRKYLPNGVNIFFYILCELAIIACDLAEVIGTAIALNLIFGLPVTLGIILTGLDVMVILFGWNTKHFRRFEIVLFGCVALVFACFVVLIIKAQPEWLSVFKGFVPNRLVLDNRDALYIAMGILGATVMPHNLYLHSHIVKFRTPKNEGTTEDNLGVPLFVETFDEPECNEVSPLNVSTQVSSVTYNTIPADYMPLVNPNSPFNYFKLIKNAIMYSNYDSILALSVALLVNSSILIVAAAAFYKIGETNIAELKDAHSMITANLGPFAGFCFALALLLSGQSSTITGTIAGQICMDGFLGNKIKLAPWLRRIITRSLAIVPAVLFAVFKGEDSINDLLVLSQVVLSLQLPFAVIPLVYFTCSKEIMTIKHKVGNEEYVEKSYENSKLLGFLAVIVSIVLTFLNGVLIYQSLFMDETKK
ncbi:hypothetical protein HK099_006056 [Clydaea vesicula]|uniref:Uncharacterized protein n=1 Tax=Clydaea vesicula TaxID=447962 RepID=A0AAD5XZE8_9FUNG|nr:hypothetical protein HK099_006056 [Clydaea vesicula]